MQNGSVEVNENMIAKTDDYCFLQNQTKTGALVTEAMLCYYPPTDVRLTLYPIGKCAKIIIKVKGNMLNLKII